MLESVSPMEVPATGGEWVTLKGKNFGILDTKPVVRIGGKDCAQTRWVSPTELRCLTAMHYGKNVPVIANVADRDSNIMSTFTFLRKFFLLIVAYQWCLCFVSQRLSLTRFHLPPALNMEAF